MFEVYDTTEVYFEYGTILLGLTEAPDSEVLRLDERKHLALVSWHGIGC